MYPQQLAVAAGRRHREKEDGWDSLQQTLVGGEHTALELKKERLQAEKAGCPFRVFRIGFFTAVSSVRFLTRRGSDCVELELTTNSKAHRKTRLESIIEDSERRFQRMCSSSYLCDGGDYFRLIRAI